MTFNLLPNTNHIFSSKTKAQIQIFIVHLVKGETILFVILSGYLFVITVNLIIGPIGDYYNLFVLGALLLAARFMESSQEVFAMIILITTLIIPCITMTDLIRGDFDLTTQKFGTFLGGFKGIFSKKTWPRNFTHCF
eukprot:UN06375